MEWEGRDKEEEIYRKGRKEKEGKEMGKEGKRRERYRRRRMGKEGKRDGTGRDGKVERNKIGDLQATVGNGKGKEGVNQVLPPHRRTGGRIKAVPLVRQSTCSLTSTYNSLISTGTSLGR